MTSYNLPYQKLKPSYNLVTIWNFCFLAFCFSQHSLFNEEEFHKFSIQLTLNYTFLATCSCDYCRLSITKANSLEDRGRS